MNQERAKIRRELIRGIVLNNRKKYAMSVDDWWRVVCNHWPDGWEYAPAKTTVKRELQDMHLLWN